MKPSLGSVIATLSAELAQKPAKVYITTARQALRCLEEAQKQEREVIKLQNDQYHYTNLVLEYNALLDVLRAVGVEVFQEFRRNDWTWTYNTQQGHADTVSNAVLLALKAYGGKYE